ncbi:MAG: polysaccharide export protein [Sphingopyxis sp.]|nr:polysaccharide export protein [Sphingopyxis sp.]
MIGSKHLLLLAFPLLVAGCAGSVKPVGGAANVRVVESSVLPEPSGDDYRLPGRAYAIGPFDKLRIDVLGMPEFSLEEIQTDAGGHFSLPLAGSIEAAGLTPAEVAVVIRDRLRNQHVRDPQVSVNLTETVSQVITVEGEVKKPGLYPALGNMTLLSAVARAEGTTEFTNTKDVIVFRTVGQQKYAALYSLAAIRRGAYDDPQIYANDRVVIGDSPQRRLFRDILQVVPLITTPLVVALQNNN